MTVENVRRISSKAMDTVGQDNSGWLAGEPAALAGFSHLDFFFFFFLTFLKCIYFERVSTSKAEAEREGREDPKQAPCYQHRARCGARTQEP